MIEVCGVSKRYGSVAALTDVSLRVEKGTVLGLLGQNGAGKTTLLNILTGYLAPTDGCARIDGFDSLLEPAEAKRRLGYLPEHPPLYDEMTTREYLRFVCALKGAPKGAINAQVDDILEKCGLAEMRDRLLGHLSKGYRQRAGMAQALCGETDALVLDEPTVGLDPKQVTEIRALIQALGKEHTIIFSSHTLSEVQQLCDHVVILHRGRVRLDAPLGAPAPEGEITLSCALAAPEERLRELLPTLAGVRSVRTALGARAEETAATLVFHGQPEPERALFTLMSGLDIPILRLGREAETLEQIFLRAISE